LIQIPPETFTAWNGLALAHYVGSIAKLALTGQGSLGALTSIMVRGLTIPYYRKVFAHSSLYCKESKRDKGWGDWVQFWEREKSVKDGENESN